MIYFLFDIKSYPTLLKLKRLHTSELYLAKKGQTLTQLSHHQPKYVILHLAYI